MIVGFIYATAAAVAWGLVYAMDQKILMSVSPTTLLFVGSLVSAVILLPAAYADRQSLTALLSSGQKHAWLILVSIGVALMADYFILSAIARVGASAASIVEIAYPFFVIVFVLLLFREVPSAQFLLGAGLIFLGTIIVIRFA